MLSKEKALHLPSQQALSKRNCIVSADWDLASLLMPVQEQFNTTATIHDCQYNNYKPP